MEKVPGYTRSRETASDDDDVEDVRGEGLC
jgi:hypothetical protein